MKIRTFAAIAAGLALTASVASAAHVWEDPSGWWDDHWVIATDPSPLFNANEVTIDLFATYTAQQRGIEDVFDTNIRKNDNPGAWWGGGVGLNYFFSRNMGIGADINIPDNNGKFIDSAHGSLFLRLPWEAAHLAPYVFGGAGTVTEPDYEWAFHAGVGLEFRFNPVTGIFTDARYVWSDDRVDDDAPFTQMGKYDGDHLILRAGLRLAF